MIFWNSQLIIKDGISACKRAQQLVSRLKTGSIKSVAAVYLRWYG